MGAASIARYEPIPHIIGGTYTGGGSQLYIKDVIGSVLRPHKELKGFEKVSLEPGESKTVSFTISPGMLAFTGLDMEEVIEAGEYVVMVGRSSVDQLSVGLDLRVTD